MLLTITTDSSTFEYHNLAVTSLNTESHCPSRQTHMPSIIVIFVFYQIGPPYRMKEVNTQHTIPLGQTDDITIYI